MSTRIGVWLYRTTGGRLSSGRRDVTVLLLTSPGRRSGVPRSTCVRYLDRPAGLIVWGTGSGSHRDPDWFQNLRAAPTAEVRLGSRRLLVERRELNGAERDSTWREVILAAAPEVEKYARRAGRTIPVAVLRPADSARPGHAGG